MVTPIATTTNCRTWPHSLKHSAWEVNLESPLPPPNNIQPTREPSLVPPAMNRALLYVLYSESG